MVGNGSAIAMSGVAALYRDGTASGLGDGQLLDRFADRRDLESAEVAFSTLVARHGAMVLRTCRKILGDEHDAQDAAQAAFLVLARRARSIARRDSAGPWLHGVARRVAAKARVAASRRRVHERNGAIRATETTVPVDDGACDDLLAELDRLPETFRAPLVLCHLEGLTQEQAAARLRCPLGTVQSRLARGRQRLRAGLVRRGAAPLMAALGPGATLTRSLPPAAWSDQTARAAVAFAGPAGVPTGASSGAIHLTTGVLTTMRTAIRWKTLLGGLALIFGTGLIGLGLARSGGQQPTGRTVQDTPPAGDLAKGDLAKLQGRWVATDPAKVNPDLAAMAWEIEGTTLLNRTTTVNGLKAEIKSLIRLDERADPRAIDFVQRTTPVARSGVKGDKRDAVERCLYRFEGETLVICGKAGIDQPRPAAFPAAGGDPTLKSVTFRRDGPAPAPVPVPAVAMPADGGHRIVQGLVRGSDGRPMAKVWVGSDPRPLAGDWRHPYPADRLRERAEPYRDGRGQVVPPGESGRYFEMRDTAGNWHPVHPDDVKPEEPRPSTGADGRTGTKEEAIRQYGRYSVRTEPGKWWMAGMSSSPQAVRTDAKGWFRVGVDVRGSEKLHFASADFAEQAIHLVRPEDDGQPIEVTLRPTRLVRFKIVEEPRDDPESSLSWTCYTLDSVGEIGPAWREWFLPDFNAHNPSGLKHRLETRLPAGKYKFEIVSQTLRRLIDVEVLPGNGTLDLPDVRLTSLAHVRMVGGPPAEIEATDLDGRPVRLADFKGKVVLLDFWATWCGPCVQALPRLVALRQKFKDQPFEVVALHDASHGSAEAYRAAFGPIRADVLGGEALPFPVLLDRTPDGPKAGEPGSGRTASAYEVYSWPSTFLIGRDGRLIGKFEPDALEGAIEDALGLPRSTVPPPAIDRDHDSKIKPEVAVRGRVVGPAGPVAEALIVPQMSRIRERGEIRTGPDGGFAFTAEDARLEIWFRVEAPGLAKRAYAVNLRQDQDVAGLRFSYPGATFVGLDPGGEIKVPLEVGPGATVTGRLVCDGRGVPGATVGLHQVRRGLGEYLGDPETKTDADGRFRFEHVPEDQEDFVYAATGGLADRGSVIPRPFKTGGHGSTLDVGALEVRPGRSLGGRVVFADGKAIPPKTKVLASAERASGLIYGDVGADGRFEVHGLPETQVSIAVQFPEIHTWMPPGYRMSARNRCLDPLNHFHLVGMLPRDIGDLTILYEPGEPPASNMEPGALADFKEASAGPIAGAPPDGR